MRPANSGRPLPPRDREVVRRQRAFTLIELLAVLVIFILLAATFVPYAMSLREVSNRARCAAQLVSIRKALDVYGEANRFDNRVLLPRVRFDPTLGGTWTAFTGPDDANPFVASSSVQPNDVSASLWLLVREGYAQPEWFVCPSSDGDRDALEDATGAACAEQIPRQLPRGIESHVRRLVAVQSDRRISVES